MSSNEARKHGRGMSLPVRAPAGEAFGVLCRFRVECYECLHPRTDALFEPTDTVLCAGGPVKTLVELSPAVEYGVGPAACTRAGPGPYAFVRTHRITEMMPGSPVSGIESHPLSDMSRPLKTYCPLQVPSQARPVGASAQERRARRIRPAFPFGSDCP